MRFPWLGPSLEIRIVTGADRSHGASLLQFIQSAQRFESATRLTVYDLGLTADQRAGIAAILPPAELKTFPFSQYPSWFNIAEEAGQYAWKPTIIASELRGSNVPLVWMDAGNVLKRPIRDARTDLKRNGFYSPKSSGTIPDWTHPGTLSALGLPANWGNTLKNLNGACVAFDPGNSAARAIAEEWAALALRREVIAPEGSSRANHRQDQALLSVLAYRSGIMTEPRRKHRDFDTHRDIDA